MSAAELRRATLAVAADCPPASIDEALSDVLDTWAGDEADVAVFRGAFAAAVRIVNGKRATRLQSVLQ